MSSGPKPLPVDVDQSLGEEAQSYFLFCAVQTGAEFGTEPFAAPIQVRRATSSETPAHYKPGLIIITSDANQNQVRLHLGHEVFHWLCSPPFYFHWVHEMFAQVMSVRLLRQGGFDAYADENNAAFRESADKLPVEKMLGEGSRR